MERRNVKVTTPNYSARAAADNKIMLVAYSLTLSLPACRRYASACLCLMNMMIGEQIYKRIAKRLNKWENYPGHNVM